jgi:hypothetical protein
MGIYTSAYVAYGVQIPDTDSETLEDATFPEGVGYLHAGGYDRNLTFLVTYCEAADLGDTHRFNPREVTDEQYAAWDESLRVTAYAMEIGATLHEPCWFVVPDQS